MSERPRSGRTGRCGRSSGQVILAVASAAALVWPAGFASASATPAAANTAAHGGGRTWVERPPLNHARLGLDVATADGRIFAIGGFFDLHTPAFDFVEARRVAGQGRWRTLAPLPTARANLATAALNGIVYAAGGIDRAGATLDVVEKFDPRTGSWSPSPSLPQPRDGAGAAASGGLLYVAGGSVLDGDAGQVTDSMVAFDPRKGTWRTMAPMPTARQRIRLVAAGPHLYAIGGFSVDGRRLSTVERYEPRSNTWRRVASMNQARILPGVTTLRRGSEHFIVVVGGGGLVEQRATRLRSTEIYNLQTGRWRVIRAELPQGRASLVSATEANGTVLAIGGVLATDPEHSTAQVLALRLTNQDLGGH